MTLDLNNLETSFDRIAPRGEALVASATLEGVQAEVDAVRCSGGRARSSASWLTSRLELGLLALWP